MKRPNGGPPGSGEIEALEQIELGALDEVASERLADAAANPGVEGVQELTQNRLGRGEVDRARFVAGDGVDAFGHGLELVGAGFFLFMVPLAQGYAPGTVGDAAGLIGDAVGDPAVLVFQVVVGEIFEGGRGVRIVVVAGDAVGFDSAEVGYNEEYVHGPR